MKHGHTPPVTESVHEKYVLNLLLCSHSPNDVPPEPQRNVYP